MSLPTGLITNRTAKMPGDYKRLADEPRCLIVEVSIPPKAVRPNGRFHWAAKARAIKRYREEAAISCMAAMRALNIKGGWAKATLEPHFYFATNRRRDTDNLAASLKAVRDGFADAGIVADDAHFRNTEPRFRYDKDCRERVEIIIMRT